MSTKTVYDVIDTGVNYLLSVYDSWNVEKVLDKENDVFPNTLHWQFGHVLTIFDSALSMGGQNVVDIETYTKLFGYGSSPANWEGQDIPSIESIREDLKQFQIVLVNLLMNNYHRNLNNRLLAAKHLTNY